MPRQPRLVIPDLPHHVVQRGNRRQQTFFGSGDYQRYISLLADACEAHGVAVWGYCVMPNHVHLILTPTNESGLGKAMGLAHQRYASIINQRHGWTGLLWQGRYSSSPMDGSYLVACARYVELNPVRAGLVNRAEDWPWSSAQAHLAGRDDRLVQTRPLLELVPAWEEFLAAGQPENEVAAIRRAGQSGRPLGSSAFTRTLETRTGRVLTTQRPGPKPWNSGTGTQFAPRRRGST